MNFGISINDIVKVKLQPIVGKVVGAESFFRYPDSLHIVYEKCGELIGIKVRADEVEKLPPENELLVGMEKLNLPF